MFSSSTPSPYPRMDRALRVGAVVLPTTCVIAAAALWWGFDGGIRMLRDRGDAGARYLAFYTAPLLFALVVWVRVRLPLVRAHSRSVLLVDVCVVAGATMRVLLGTAAPFSGHMLFLTYSLFAAPAHRAYRVLAFAVLIETTIFKLLIWSDARSWAWGLVFGAAAAGIANAISRRAAT